MKDENIVVKRKEDPTINELFEDIDGFLAHIEDFLHGDDGEDCTQSRSALSQLKDSVYVKIQDAYNDGFGDTKHDFDIENYTE